MRKFVYILSVCLFLSLVAEAQDEHSFLSETTTDTQTADTTFEIKKDWLSFHSSVFFGKNFFDENMFVSDYGFDYARQINDRTRLFVGFDIMNADVKPRDLAPRRTKTAASAYVGMQYDVNDRLTLAGSVFYNSLYNTLGADIDVTYRFSEDSYLNFYAMFSKSLDDYSFRPSF